MKKKRPQKKAKDSKASAASTGENTIVKLSSPVCYAQSNELRDEYKTDKKKE